MPPMVAVPASRAAASAHSGAVGPAMEMLVIATADVNTDSVA